MKDDIFIFDESGTILIGVLDCSIKSVTIPNSVTSIGDNALKGCSALTSITIPDSVASIGDEAFRGCSSLTSIDIPNSVTSIGVHAFRDCSSLTSIDLPNSVTSIGFRAFADCSCLTSINIPDSVTSIGHEAFKNCISLRTIYSKILTIENIHITDNAFDGITFDKCTLYVPPSTVWAYRHHLLFSKFKNIEIEPRKKE